MDTACRKMSAPGNRCVVTQSRSRRSAQGRERARTLARVVVPAPEDRCVATRRDAVAQSQLRLGPPPTAESSCSPPAPLPTCTHRESHLAAKGQRVLRTHARVHARTLPPSRYRAVDTARHFDYLCIETRHRKQALQRCVVYRQIVIGTRHFRVGLFRLQISARAQAQQDLE